VIEPALSAAVEVGVGVLVATAVEVAVGVEVGGTRLKFVTVALITTL
jgi:hypothetical protein